MWDALMKFFTPIADFLDKPFSAIYVYVPWWCGVIFIIGAVIIAAVDHNKYYEDGLGSGYFFWHILFLCIAFVIWGICRLADDNVRGSTYLNAAGSIFLIFLIWPTIRFIILLFKNRKSSLWVYPYYILWFVGLLPLIDYIGALAGGLLLLGGMGTVMLGGGKSEYKLSNGTKVEGYGDDKYYDKSGNSYTKNSDNTFTKDN